MKENLTEIIFILDRSGSMQDLTQDTIGGFNSFIEQQKTLPGEAIVTTVLFDDRYDILHNGVNIQDIKPLTTQEYFPRGMTALLDAVGKTINTVGARLSSTKEEDRPSKVIMVITTDGQENSSKEFELAKIKEMVEHQTNVYNWQFLFLGANIDAISAGMSFGIGSTFSAKYTASSVGTQSVYHTLANTVTSYRSSGTVSTDWKDEVE